MPDTSFWLLKTEPDHYSYADLARDGAAVWDGVSNNAVLERRAVGLAEVTSAPYPDPPA